MGLLKGLFVFGLGLYAGVYVCQNYKVPPVDKPEEMYAKAKAWLEQVNKDYKKTTEKGE